MYDSKKLRTELYDVETEWQVDSLEDADRVEKRACLEHSCNEWVIGGPDEIRLLIKDLEALLLNWEK